MTAAHPLRALVLAHGGSIPTYIAERTLGRVTPAMRREAGVRRVLDCLVLPPAPTEPRSSDGVAAGVAVVHAPADQRVQNAARRGPNPGARPGAGSPGVKAEGVTLRRDEDLPGAVPTTAPTVPRAVEVAGEAAERAGAPASTAGPRVVAPNVVPGRPVVSRAGGNALATPKGRAKAIATTRAKGDATRAKILAALVKAGTKGLVAQQLAKAAGVSLAGVSRHRAAMGDLVVRDGHTTRLRYYHRDYAPVRKARPGLHVRVAELEERVAELERMVRGGER